MKVFKRSKAYASFEYTLLIPLVIIIAIFLFVIVKNSAKTLPWLDNALGKTPASTEEPESYKLNVTFYNLGDMETEGPGPEGWDGLKKDARSDINIQDMKHFGYIPSMEIDESGELVFIKNVEMEGPPRTNKEIIEYTTNLYMGFLSTVDRNSETLYNKFIIEEVIREFPPGFEDPGDKKYYLEFKPASFIPKKQICTNNKPPGGEVGRFLESIFTVKAYSEVSFSGCYNQFDVNFFINDLDGNRSKDFSFNVNIEDEGEYCVEGSCVPVEEEPYLEVRFEDPLNIPKITINEDIDEIDIKNYFIANNIKVFEVRNETEEIELLPEEYEISYINKMYTDEKIEIQVKSKQSMMETYEYLPWNIICTLATDSDFMYLSGVPWKGSYSYIGTYKCVEIPDKINGTSLTNYRGMFANKIVYKVVSRNTNIISMEQMFFDSQGFSLDLSELETSSVENMDHMFYESETKILNISNFNTSNVTNMYGMFRSSAATSLDISSFNTSKVLKMDRLFQSSKATEIIGLESLDVSKIGIASYMFNNSSAKVLDLSNFDTRNFTYFEYMFSNSKAEQIILGNNFKISNAYSLQGMFKNISVQQLDLSNFDMSNVVVAIKMFEGANIPNLDISGFYLSSTNITIDSMFLNYLGNNIYIRSEDLSKLNSKANKPSTAKYIIK